MAVPAPFPCLSAPGSLADLWCFFVRFAPDRFSRAAHEIALLKSETDIFSYGPKINLEEYQTKRPEHLWGICDLAFWGLPGLDLHKICKSTYTSFAKIFTHNLQKYLHTYYQFAGRRRDGPVGLAGAPLLLLPLYDYFILDSICQLIHRKMNGGNLCVSAFLSPMQK